MKKELDYRAHYFEEFYELVEKFNNKDLNFMFCKFKNNEIDEMSTFNNTIML